MEEQENEIQLTNDVYVDYSVELDNLIYNSEILINRIEMLILILIFMLSLLLFNTFRKVDR